MSKFFQTSIKKEKSINRVKANDKSNDKNNDKVKIDLNNKKKNTKKFIISPIKEFKEDQYNCNKINNEYIENSEHIFNKLNNNSKYNINYDCNNLNNVNYINNSPIKCYSPISSVSNYSNSNFSNSSNLSNPSNPSNSSNNFNTMNYNKCVSPLYSNTDIIKNKNYNSNILSTIYYEPINNNDY